MLKSKEWLLGTILGTMVSVGAPRSLIDKVEKLIQDECPDNEGRDETRG